MCALWSSISKKSFSENGCFFLEIMDLQNISAFQKQLRKIEFRWIFIISETKRPFSLKIFMHTEDHEAHIWAKCQVKISLFDFLVNILP